MKTAIVSEKGLKSLKKGVKQSDGRLSITVKDIGFGMYEVITTQK